MPRPPTSSWLNVRGWSPTPRLPVDAAVATEIGQAPQAQPRCLGGQPHRAHGLRRRGPADRPRRADEIGAVAARHRSPERDAGRARHRGGRVRPGSRRVRRRVRAERLSAAAQQDVRATAIAALADERASAAVTSGQLTRALSYSGFGEVDLAEAVARTAGGAILTILPGGRGARVRPTAPARRSGTGSRAGRAAFGARRLRSERGG